MYNYSPNAARLFIIHDRINQNGRTRILIRCPFCENTFWGYIWSISGRGKKCTNKSCGAIHTSYGLAYPVSGREPQ